MKSKKVFVSDDCVACGGSVRLVGLETHAKKPNIEVLTFACHRCKAITVAEAGVGEYFGPVR